MALARQYVAIARGTMSGRKIRDNLTYARETLARLYFASASVFR
jgi:hypothetical protein